MRNTIFFKEFTEHFFKHGQEANITLSFIDTEKTLFSHEKKSSYFIYGLTGCMTVSCKNVAADCWHLHHETHISLTTRGDIRLCPLVQPSCAIALHCDAAAMVDLCPMLSVEEDTLQQSVTPPQVQHLLQQISSCQKCQLLFSQFYNQHTATKNMEPVEFKPSELVAVQKAYTLLLKDITSPPSLHELAHAVGLHRTRLSALFKSQYGDTVFGILRRERLQHALVLLQENRQNITEIAYSCGFSSPSHLTRLFQNKYGLSPKQYQSKHYL